jgi:hypothetical protein
LPPVYLVLALMEGVWTVWIMFCSGNAFQTRGDQNSFRAQCKLLTSDCSKEVTFNTENKNYPTY